MSETKKATPLLYSCSGASSAAQMTNHIAVRLDRLKIAEMSCIAGVGGDVKSLVRVAKSGRPIVALDGCPIQCVKQILKRQNLVADRHYDLSEMGVKKQYHEDFDPRQAEQVLREIQEDLRSLSKTDSLPQDTRKTGSSSSDDTPAIDHRESNESSSPPCYLNEMKDW